MYETHSKVKMRVSWERKIDLKRFRHDILLYWVGMPERTRQGDYHYRNMRKGAAARELCRMENKCFVAKGGDIVSRDRWLTHFSDKNKLQGAYVRCKSNDGLRWLGKIHERNYMRDQSHIPRFLDDPGPLKIDLLKPATLQTLMVKLTHGVFDLPN